MSKKSRSLPRHATVLSTYAELAEYAQAFAQGHLQSVVLLGPPGIGKSATVRSVLGERVCWISGNASAFGVYIKAYEHLDEPIILDDVDDLYRQPAGVRLLKALCQSDARRTLNWQTQARELDRRNIPREFETSSPVILIANDWQTTSPNVEAVEDRVHLLVFEPSAMEIHLQAAKWYWDQEIFDFVGNHLSIIESHSFRLYVRAYELKCAGMNWSSTIFAHCYSGTARVVAELRADTSFSSEEERVAEFVARGLGCRATYFNHARNLPKSSIISVVITLTSSPPHDATVASNADPGLL